MMPLNQGMPSRRPTWANKADIKKMDLLRGRGVVIGNSPPGLLKHEGKTVAGGRSPKDS